MRLLAALLAVSCALAAALPAAHAADAPPAPVTYVEPVDARVSEEFGAPVNPYAAGNRGIDYATEPGTVVHAAAPGEVVFAGQVAGTLHLVVLHPDGIRTSYSFLRSVSVRRGQRVSAGTPLGVTGGPLHFGARAGDAYVDPAVLLGAGAPRVHLVPVDARQPGTEAEERSWLLELVSGARRGIGLVGSATVDAVAWARETAVATVDAVDGWVTEQVDTISAQLALFIHYTRAFNPAFIGIDAARAFRRWRHGDCTPDDVTVPLPRDRRILVLVGGLGSSGGDAAVLDLDAAALGYDRRDVVQFSYRGGAVPGIGALSGVPRHHYRREDTEGSIWESGRRLRSLLEDIRLGHPGVPVDVVAHSMGGLVARAALGGTTAFDPRLPEIGALITLGTPHQGADLATAVQAFRTTTSGSAGLEVLERLGDLDADSPAARELSETSGFIDELAELDVPGTIRLTSIAARGDWVAAGPRAQLDGATNVVVPLDGAGAHRALPGSGEASREVGLALAGLPPGCQSIAELALAVIEGMAISYVEDRLGAGLTGGAIYLERKMPTPRLPPVALPGGRRSS